MTSSDPSVCYVVLNWNQPGLTAECLESLAVQAYANYHVVVVDNGSTDGSAGLLAERFPWVTMLELQDNVGYSAGNNAGIDYALAQGADYILLLNNDTLVDPHMLARLVAAAEADPSIGIAGPTMYYAEPPTLIWGSENRIDWRTGSLIRGQMGETADQQRLDRLPPRPVDYVDTCAALIRREVFERIGGMNDDYFINFDDLDLNVRASKAGYQIVYVPAARMWHRVSLTMGQASPATTYYMTRNALIFFWSHAPGVWRLLASLQIVWRTLWAVSAWSVKRRYRSDLYRRKRKANLLALRDFAAHRWGRMGPDVTRVCYGEGSR